MQSSLIVLSQSVGAAGRAASIGVRDLAYPPTALGAKPLAAFGWIQTILLRGEGRARNLPLGGRLASLDHPLWLWPHSTTGWGRMNGCSQSGMKSNPFSPERILKSGAPPSS